MKIIFSLLIALLQCILVASQVVVGPSQAGFGNMDLATGTYVLTNNMNYGNNFGQGFATFDHWNKRYIYTVSGGGAPDTLITLDAHDGTVLSRNPYPSQGLFNPQYCASVNKVYGFHPGGFASFDLSTNTYSIINNVFYGNGYGQGLNTMNQARCEYMYTIHGMAFSDTLVILDVSNGNILQKIHYPQDGLFNPEYAQLSNSVFGLTQTGFARLDLNTSTYTVISNGNFGSGAIQGISTFDQSNYHYIFTYAGSPPSDTMCVVNAATGAVASKFPFPKDHLFNGEYTKMNPFVSRDNAASLAGFTIYPNPAASKVRVDLHGATGKVEIIDALGQVVLARTQFTDGEISLEALAPGYYVVSVAQEGQVQRQKLIKY